ncbi:PAS domain S-box protein [Flavobacterium weaverense]|uniref:histidine kinase n=1 Tax=Flavobacterium weaverense TaxID=271156 RepID=A0A3L9ZFD4_9FLAO|nr:PAS domain S-box protein [Flavobacterium weaverense]RMA71671.1 PAS domain S-box-containing protein [Flavobacterium weaverense]
MGKLSNLEANIIFDAAQKDTFNFYTTMASEISVCPISFVSLFTNQESVLLSSYGLADIDSIKDFDFLRNNFTKSTSDVIIEDTRIDPLYSKLSLGESNPKIIFYAAIPLFDFAGIVIGSLCVIDLHCRKLSNQQLEFLQKLALQIAISIEVRKNQFDLESKNNTLIEANTLLEIIQDSNQIGIWEIDVNTMKTSWNDFVYDILEVPKDFNQDLKNDLNFYHHDYREIISNAVSNAIIYKTPFDVICLLVTAKENNKWARVIGKRVGEKIIGSFQDITAIKERELKFEGIFDSTMTFIGFLNTEGILLEVNKTALNVAGIKKEDVIGKYFWDCYWWQISEKAQEELKVNFKKALAGQEVSYEVRINIANEQTTTLLFSLRPLFNEQGKVLFIIPQGREVEELVIARDRFKNVLDGTNVGTWEWKVQTGESIFNERWAEIVGYTLAELEPINIDTWFRLAHPDDLEESTRRTQLCFDRKTEFYEIETRMRHKSGTWVWVRDHGKVIEWTENNMPLTMFGTHEDITKRKIEELEISYQRKNLNALYKLSPIGIALNDYETGEFIDVNEKLFESSGYSKKEFLALRYSDVTPKEFQHLDLIAIQQMEQKSGYDKYQKEYIRKDGSRYPVLLSGVVIEDLSGKKLVWSFIQDISEEKAAEQKLNDAIIRMQAVLNATTEVVIIETDIDGKITLFNSGAEIMLGYKADEVVGNETPEIIHVPKEIVANSLKLFEKYNEEIRGFESLIYEIGRGESVTKEWTYKRKDGSKFPVLLSVSPVIKNNNVTGYLGVATDISALKKVENEIKSLLDITKEQNNRLKNFANIVSHNLRSHSGGISGLIDLLISEFPEIDENEISILLKHGADNLQQTVDDLIDVVKINLSEIKSEEIRVFDFVEKNIQSLALQIKKTNFLINNQVEKEVLIQGIPAYIDSIILNFISNAIKYQSQERESYLNIHTYEEDNFVVLNFVDNGLGINLDKYGDKIFGMYKTFHQYEDSRGIGLFISKNQVESLGGKIEVLSEENVGTTFKIKFPLHKS